MITGSGGERGPQKLVDSAPSSPEGHSERLLRRQQSLNAALIEALAHQQQLVSDALEERSALRTMLWAERAAREQARNVQDLTEELVESSVVDELEDELRFVLRLVPRALLSDAVVKGRPSKTYHTGSEDGDLEVARRISEITARVGMPAPESSIADRSSSSRMEWHRKATEEWAGLAASGLDVVKCVEWAGTVSKDTGGRCPVCHRLESVGHGESCELQAFLNRVDRRISGESLRDDPGSAGR